MPQQQRTPESQRHITQKCISYLHYLTCCSTQRPKKTEALPSYEIAFQTQVFNSPHGKETEIESQMGS